MTSCAKSYIDNPMRLFKIPSCLFALLQQILLHLKGFFKWTHFNFLASVYSKYASLADKK